MIDDDDEEKNTNCYF